MKAARKRTRTNRSGRRATKSARVELRLTPAQKRLIERASMLQGKTISSYMADSAVATAREEIEREHRIVLNEQQSRELAELLLNPPEPSPFIVQVARDYRNGKLNSGF